MLGWFIIPVNNIAYFKVSNSRISRRSLRKSKLLNYENLWKRASVLTPCSTLLKKTGSIDSYFRNIHQRMYIHLTYITYNTWNVIPFCSRKNTSPTDPLTTFVASKSVTWGSWITYLQFADPPILRLWNCKGFRRVTGVYREYFWIWRKNMNSSSRDIMVYFGLIRTENVDHAANLKYSSIRSIIKKFIFFPSETPVTVCPAPRPHLWQF